jgi:threonine/homoserine/homoserine lactone efflux protein
MNYKILMTVTGVLIIANLLIGFFTNFWGETKYPDYINSVLGVFLILFGTQVFSKENKKESKEN